MEEFEDLKKIVEFAETKKKAFYKEYFGEDFDPDKHTILVHSNVFEKLSGKRIEQKTVKWLELSFLVNKYVPEREDGIMFYVENELYQSSFSSLLSGVQR